MGFIERLLISQKLKENDQTPSDIDKLIVHGVSELVSLVDKHTITTLSKRRSIQSQHAANIRHSMPGGSRDKQKQIRELWASGKYTSRDICAEQECAALGMSFSSARKALRNTPKPDKTHLAATK